MVDIILVQFLTLIFLTSVAFARMDKLHGEGYLGERRLDEYHERYYPLVDFDLNRGQMKFEDEVFFQDFFTPFLFGQETQYSHFLKNELNAGIVCSNDLLSQHLDDIHYAYRLISLSYLLEGQWHLSALSSHFGMKKGCHFDLLSWAKSCRPQHPEMKKFVSRLIQYNPRYQESFPLKYSASDWLKTLRSKKYEWYSHYRLEDRCQNCSEKELEQNLNVACHENQELMNKICDEVDELYGLSNELDAYYLLSQSNIVNTFNQLGEAQGCLRRFAEVMAHKEVRYPAIKNLFPPLRSFLKITHGERFTQGRVFFFGSGKEFEQKGLSDFYVKEQPIVVQSLPRPPEPAKVSVPQPTVKKEVPKKISEPAPSVAEIKTPEPEIKKVIKSAFYQAAEIRSSAQLDQVEVDMQKLKYDYVFTLHMINNLAERLKTFMGREALKEMVTYDKLGTKEGPVPLLFIKFMIDMEEHQGLWNLINVVGAKFYVSNEIDAGLNPGLEYVELINNQSSGNRWQLLVLRPY